MPCTASTISLTWSYEAEYPEGFPIINLGAWNDDPIVIQAIKEKIDLLMD